MGLRPTMDLRALKYGRVSDSGFVKVWGTENLDPPELISLLPGAVYSTKYSSWFMPYNALELVRPTTPAPTYRPCKTPAGLAFSRIQNAAEHFIERTPIGCVVAAGTGQGKTLVALEYAYQHPELRPILVVGPVESSGVWLEEGADPAKHYGFTSTWLRTKTPDLAAFRGLDRKPFDIYFINYEILADWKMAINANLKPRLVVLDEADEVCNVRTKSSKAAESVCSQAGVFYRILLTATPVNNEIMELYGILTKAQPKGHWGKWVDFGVRYAGGFEDEYGWHMHDESNVAELVSRLRSAIFRETDVKDWTALHRDVEYVPTEALLPTPMREYKFASTDIRKLIAIRGGSFQGQALQQYTAMSKALSAAKTDYAISAAERFVLELPRQKGIVFTWFRESAERLVEGLGYGKSPLRVYGPLLGGGTYSKKVAMVEAFAEDKKPAVIVATLETAKRSLNRLSSAQGVLFTDMWYVPGAFLQAEGRINRRGQTAEDIYSRALLVPNSMDTIMWGYMERKARLIEKTAGGDASSLVEALGGRGRKETVQSLLADLAELGEEDLELQ